MYYLANCDDVILSPHIAGQTIESSKKHVDVIIAKIKELPFMSR
jgi:phosphoglycerate dehydrogenase-like enzyme